MNMQLFLSFFLVITLLSCQKEQSIDEYSEPQVLELGARNVHKLCISCHAFKHEADHAIAPSLKAIQKAYRSQTDNKEHFISAMTSFLNDPSEDNAKLPEAVEKYGLMPKMSYTQTQIKTVASYLYEADLDNPKAIEKNNEISKQGEGRYDYFNQGLDIALATKAELGKNLMGAIKNKGTIGAIDFCHTNALSITKEKSNEYQVKIKRVSDKNRNTKNRANAQELFYLQLFRDAKKQGQAMPGVVVELADVVHFYAPIWTNNMCLQCHGVVGQELKNDVRDFISKKYPDDLAVGYGNDELRGIWSIEWSK